MTLLATLLAASAAACYDAGIWDSASCCACLISRSPDGAMVAGGDLEEVVPNCLAGERTINQENALCSAQAADQMTGVETAIEVEEMACVDLVCRQECAELVEEGFWFLEETERRPDPAANEEQRS
jgi:hypothetical protein